MMDRQSNGQSPGCLGSDSTQASPIIVPIPVAKEAATTPLRSEPANSQQTSWENRVIAARIQCRVMLMQ